MNNENILITGGEGVLGSYFSFGVRLDQKDLDITDLNMVMRVCIERKPQVIIHCAALTDLSFCEQNPDKAYLVNSVGTYHLALAARAIGAKLIYISTSGVFDGTKPEPYTEKDIPNPVNVYGHSKYLGELAVASILTDYLIVRTSWIFGGGKGRDTKFVGKIMSQVGNSEIKAVTDKLGSPTYAKDLANAIEKLIEEDSNGIIHLGGGVATRYDVANEIISITGSSASVEPITSEGLSAVYASGKNESMNESRYMRPWQGALREYVNMEWKSVIKETT